MKQEYASGDNEKVAEEIEWGSAFRKKREATFPLKLRPLAAPREQVFIEKIKKPVNQGWANVDKLKELKKAKKKKISLVVNRDTLTDKEHISMLATPKRLPFIQHGKVIKEKPVKPTRPRILQLAIPKKGLVFSTWKSYYNVLEPQKIENLNEMLNAETSMNLDMAQKCFEAMQRKQSRKEKVRKRKLIKKRKQQQKMLNRFATGTARKFTNRIFAHNIYHLNYHQKAISDKMINELKKGGYVKNLSRKNRGAYKRTLVDVVDRCAVFMDTILATIDKELADKTELVSSEEETSSYTSEETDSDLEISDAAIKMATGGFPDDMLMAIPSDISTMSTVITDILDKILGYVYQIKDLADGQFDMRLLISRLLAILSEYSQPHLQNLFGDDGKPSMTLQKVISELIRLQENVHDDITPIAHMQHNIEQQLKNWVAKQKPDALDENMNETIHFVSQYLANSLMASEQSQMWKRFSADRTRPIEMGEGQILEDKAQIGKEMEFMSTTNQMEGGVDATMQDTTILEQGEEQEGEDATDGLGDEEGKERFKSALEVIEDGEEEEDGEEDGEEQEVVEGEEELEENEESGEGEEGEVVVEGEEGGEGEVGVEGEEGEAGEEGEEGGEEGGEIEGEEGDGQILEEKEGEGEISGEEQGLLEEGSGEGEDEGEGVEDIETILAEFGEAGADDEREIRLIEEEIRSEEGKMMKSIEDTRLGIIREEDELVEEEEGAEGAKQEIVKETKTYGHVPNTVCCASLKAWAAWTNEVSDNAQKWSLWMVQTMKDMKYMASIVKGEITDEYGQKVSLTKEEWDSYVERLEKDVVTWRHYNSYIQNLIDEVSNYFHDKRVECCDLCREKDLATIEVTPEHMCEQLAEALDASKHWKKWLDSMVPDSGASTSAVQDENMLPQIKTAGSEVSNQIIELGPPEESPDPEPSIYEIERVDSDEYYKRQ